MLQVELYILNTRVDLFKDESIRVTDSIKNIRDLNKVFLAFSMPFTLPASSTNNKLFKHYYDPRLSVGSSFDARFYQDAEIRINGMPYKKGKISLLGVKMKDNKPFAYNVNFYGETKKLSDLLGKDKLNSLSYVDDWSHDYSETIVRNGLVTGLTTSGTTSTLRDVIYPLIAYETRYYISTNFRDIDDNGLDYKQLKPALRLDIIIDAIEDKYGITFSDDFFVTDTTIDNLYLWLHNRAGAIIGGDEEQSVIVSYDEWAYVTGGDGDLLPITTSTVWDGQSSTAIAYTFEVTIVPDDTSGLFDIEIVDRLTGNSIRKVTNQSGASVVFSHTFGSGAERTWEPDVIVSSSGGIANFTITMDLDKSETGETLLSSEYDTTPAAQQFDVIDYVRIQSQMPDMKVIDFLTSLFNTFNLVAYYQDDGTIYVNTLDGYYAETHNTWDITEYVKADSHEVNKGLLYREIDFEFKSDASFLVSNGNLKVQRESPFGYSYYDGGDNYDGGKYTIKLGWEKFMYERLEDGVAGTLSNIQIGRMVDENEDAYKGAPLIFYNENQSVSTPVIRFPIAKTNNITTTYNRPSNVNAAETQNLHWDSEIDEYNLTENTESLFDNFYKTYIENVFDVRTKVFKYKAVLPQFIVSQYELNDRWVVHGVKFKANEISVDITTGEAELELITE